MKDLVACALEDYFLFIHYGRPDVAEDCLELARTLCKDDFDEKYKEIAIRTKIRLEGGKVSEYHGTITDTIFRI